MTKLEQAKAWHERGMNCAQSVALPFCEELGVDPQLAMRALEGFGAGMGDRKLTCGALSGAVFVTGLKHSDGDLEHPQSKADTYAVCAKLCEAFVSTCGTDRCEVIKSEDRVSCAECIALGVKLAEEC